MRTALQLAPLLCQRPGKLANMEWAELDLDATLWTIPSMKMKRTRAKRKPWAPRQKDGNQSGANDRAKPSGSGIHGSSPPGQKGLKGRAVVALNAWKGGYWLMLRKAVDEINQVIRQQRKA